MIDQIGIPGELWTLQQDGSVERHPLAVEFAGLIAGRLTELYATKAESMASYSKLYRSLQQAGARLMLQQSLPMMAMNYLALALGGQEVIAAGSPAERPGAPIPKMDEVTRRVVALELPLLQDVKEPAGGASMRLWSWIAAGWSHMDL